MAGENRMTVPLLDLKAQYSTLREEMLPVIEEVLASQYFINGPEVKEFEAAGDFTSRLAMMEELKSMPFGAVWDAYCQRNGAPVGPAWLEEVRAYERQVLSRR